jgi:autotransporter-associated beta strand protein
MKGADWSIDVEAEASASARAAVRLVGRRFERTPGRLWAMAGAAALAALASPAQATSLCAPQTPPTLCSDQASVLSPFGSLSPAVLNANMTTEEAIYADPTGTGNAALNAARRTLAAENALVQQAPQSILIGAFPGNVNFGFDAYGVPTLSTPIPSAVLAAANTAVSLMATGASTGDLKSYFAGMNVYQDAYSSSIAGDPRPFQTSGAIAANPFTIANSSLIAYQIQQTSGNAETSGDPQDWASYVSSPSFPSGHSGIGNANAIMFAILAPGYYQQFLQSGVDFGYSRNVFAAHYPLDVIGGRILATYITAEVLAGDNPLYASTALNLSVNPDALKPLATAMQSYLAGAGLASGGASPYAAACAGGVATCVANGVIPTAAQYNSAAQTYAYFLNYDLTTLYAAPAVVPTDAHVLIATRFPYLNEAQLNDILASTELGAGGALDNNSGWARLNLYAAAGGYGDFASDVTVTMNKASGGLNAFDVWSNAISSLSGPYGLTLDGSGTLVLAGDNTYAGDTIVKGEATLAITGSVAGDVSVLKGATFAGNGGVGGALDLYSGATYQVAIGSNGANAIHVGGAATVAGAAVDLASVGFNPVLGSPYTILTAASVTGRFDPDVSSALLFLTPSLSYSDDDVFLTLTRNGVAFGSVADTPNQRATADAIDAEAIGRPLSEALVSQSAVGARQAFDALSGEIHASAVSAAFDDARLPREAALDRLASLDGAAATGAAAGFAAWGQGFGSFGRIGGDGDAATLDRSVGGFILGADASLDNRYRLGVAGGYTQSTLSLDARDSHGHVDSTFAGVYGGATLGALQLRGGALYAYNRYGTNRSVAFPGFNDSDSAGYGGDALQAFGEAGWRIGVAGFSGPASIEPFVGATAMRIDTAKFSESGGAAALNGAAAGYDYAATTLGARLEAALFDAAPLTARGMLGWRHVFGDATPRSTLAFASAPSLPFAVAGAPIARDALAVEAGVDWRLTRQATVGVSYSGSLARRDGDNAVKGKLEVAF